MTTKKQIQTTSTTSSITATALAQSIADQYGIDLSRITGSGRKGKIVAEDLVFFVLEQEKLAKSVYNELHNTYGQVALKECPHCKHVTIDQKFCSNCGAVLVPVEKSYHLIPDYPYRTHGPKQTHWPPPGKNFWHFRELIPDRPIDVPTTTAQIRWTPTLSLGSGEYDLILTKNSDKHYKEHSIYISKSDNPVGTLLPTIWRHFGQAMNRYRLSLFDPISMIRIGVEVEGAEHLSDLGLLLVPRLGQIWYGSELPHVQFALDGKKIDYGYQTGALGWAVQANNFREEFLTFGPYALLSPGEHTAIVRFSCANWVSDELPILLLDIFLSIKDGAPQYEPQVLTKFEIYPKDIHRSGVPQEFRCSFYLDQIVFDEDVPERQRKVECRVRTLNPADVTVHQIRLSTPDDLINEKYYKLGGIDSPLGPPLGHIFVAAPSKEGTQGYIKRYQAGSIYWSRLYGAYGVYGGIGYLYEDLGGTAGNPPDFGFPISEIAEVISCFGTKAQVQHYEGYAKHSAIYLSDTKSDECPEIAYDVYGQIGIIYFDELGGHEGPLGLPMSGEHWASEKQKIRRNYFEGGYIEAIEIEDNKWEKHKVVYYPRPILSKPTIPAPVYCGDPYTIRFEVKNHGGDAQQGYITLSFPDQNVQNIRVDSEGGEIRLTNTGDWVHWRYGSGDQIETDYPRAELYIHPFNAGETYWMDVTFTPTKIGPLRFYLRSTAGKIPKYEKLNIHFEGDPSPISSGPVDQQGEHVYEYLIDVIEKPYAELRIIDIIAPPLIQRRFDFITLLIENVGTAIAKDITVTLDELLRTRGNLKITSIDSGEQYPLPINISPIDPGEVDLQFSLTYSDQFNQVHIYDLTRRFIIHDSANPIFRLEAPQIGIPEDLLTKIGNAFSESDEFKSNQNLRNLFVVGDLSPFLAGLSDNAQNVNERIYGLIAYMFSKRLVGGSNALVVFCNTLAGRYDEKDQLHHTLKRLAAELNDYLQNPNGVY